MCWQKHYNKQRRRKKDQSEEDNNVSEAFSLQDLEQRMILHEGISDESEGPLMHLFEERTIEMGCAMKKKQ